MSILERNLVLVGKTSLGKRTFTMADSNGVVLKTSFGLADTWYGGSVKEFRKVKDSGLLMCLDKRDNIINLAYVESDLTDADMELLGIVVPNDGNKSDLDDDGDENKSDLDNDGDENKSDGNNDDGQEKDINDGDDNDDSFAKDIVTKGGKKK